MTPRKSSPPARRSRRAAAARERIMDLLISGMPVIRIARLEGLRVRRVRQIIAEMLAKRELDPATGYVQIQIARLNEAMIVAHDMMTGGDLAATDRFLKLAVELDRYHGFFPEKAAAASTPLLTHASTQREIFLLVND
jgi:hypothetical protein